MKQLSNKVTKRFLALFTALAVVLASGMPMMTLEAATVKKPGQIG